MNTIKMVQTTYELKPNTKTVWVEVETTEKQVDLAHLKRFTSDDTLKFFRRLGGIERVQRSYTIMGYLPTRVCLISPDKKLKKVTEFKID